jgi:predicted acylesterase/phospholipase RssA
VLARLAAIPLLLLGLAACASTSSREPFTAAQVERAAVPGFGTVRRFADASADEFLSEPDVRARLGALARGRSIDILALSGGADDGAYGAGFLAGWTARGDRPVFDIVTGVSTGALIAPFAFLGSARDGDLRSAYTEIEAANIFEFRGLAGLFGDGIASTGPLREMVARFVDERMLAEIAAEHRKGRRLLALTTNLDVQRAVLWNLGAIAASGHPRALELFRDVVVASASLPGLFPPVMIEAEADGRAIREMHVDGGTTANTFAVPWNLARVTAVRRLGAGQRRTLHVIVNGRIAPDFRVVPENTVSIGARGMATVLRAHGEATLREIAEFAADNRVEFRLTTIGRDFRVPWTRPFARDYMNALYAHGFDRGRSGDAWRREVQDWR